MERFTRINCLTTLNPTYCIIVPKQKTPRNFKIWTFLWANNLWPLVKNVNTWPVFQNLCRLLSDWPEKQCWVSMPAFQPSKPRLMFFFSPLFSKIASRCSFFSLIPHNAIGRCNLQRWIRMCERLLKLTSSVDIKSRLASLCAFNVIKTFVSEGKPLSHFKHLKWEKKIHYTALTFYPLSLLPPLTWSSHSSAFLCRVIPSLRRLNLSWCNWEKLNRCSQIPVYGDCSRLFSPPSRSRTMGFISGLALSCRQKHTTTFCLRWDEQQKGL